MQVNLYKCYVYYDNLLNFVYLKSEFSISDSEL